MNTYLLPICYPDALPEIISVNAYSYKEAQEMFMDKIDPDKDTEGYEYWDDFVEAMANIDYLVGDVYDKDTF